jgi:tRNA (uracil-5-)-methyltransferase TRM9
LRKSLLDKTHSLLVKTGAGQTSPLFIHSEWQFLNSERLRSRMVAWETVGLSTQDVEQGDYLLDWKHGGLGYRYVHHFSVDELERLANQSGFKVLKTYFSDGENGRLGLYQSWGLA